MKRLAFVACMALSAVGAQAAINFGFESFAATGNSGGYTSLTDTQGGITMTLVRSTGIAFDVFDTTGFGFPASWDNRAVSPFFNFTANDFFVASFSTGLSQVDVEMTDFGADSDTLFMEAFTGVNGTGTSLGTTTLNWGLQSAPNYGGLSIFSPSVAIRSVVFRGGESGISTFNSMYIDNIAVRPIPEPATLAVLGFGAAAMLRRRRKA